MLQVFHDAVVLIALEQRRRQMTRSYAPELTNMQPAPGTRLQGRRRVIARVIWAILVVLTLAFFILMLPAYFTQLQTICTASACAPGQPGLDAVRVLQAHTLTLASYVLFIFILTLVVALTCCIVGAVIFWRRSDDWMALLVALVLMTPGNVYVTYTLQQSSSIWHLPAFILNELTFAVIFLFFSLFPDGRFMPRWARWLAIGWIAWGIVMLSLPDSPLFLLLDNLVWLCIYGCSVISQIYRYWRMSGPVQRQQTKWVVYGASLTMAAVVGLKVPVLIFPSLGPGSLYDLAREAGFTLALMPFPLSIGFAVMRSRLWDIDVIINRTLVYALLTALLALVYFGSAVLLQYLFGAFTGQGSPFAVVGSTLVIAALFHPLRRHIQTFIDTCFYRRRYDAPQVLANFDAIVRSCLYSGAEESLETLTGNVQEIVEQTLQPSHISLWLYALELPKEADESAQEARHDSRVTSTLVWEDQEKTPQEHYLRVSEKNMQGKKLRNRLGNIDVLINCALIYGTLVGVIALASISILMIQQQLAQVLPAQISELFIVGSILAMVMCFKPLRRHIQSFIDRHFYPHKYQVEQRLDGFAATWRHEVNLTQLSEGLLESVNEAMESEYVSLWINKLEPASEAPRYTGVLQQ
jgi:hypothetical protein